MIQAGYLCDCTTFVVQPVRVFSSFFRRFVPVIVSDANPASVCQLPGKQKCSLPIEVKPNRFNFGLLESVFWQ